YTIVEYEAYEDNPNEFAVILADKDGKNKEQFLNITKGKLNAALKKLGLAAVDENQKASNSEEKHGTDHKTKKDSGIDHRADKIKKMSFKESMEKGAKIVDYSKHDEEHDNYMVKVKFNDGSVHVFPTLKGDHLREYHKLEE
ncbi:hypothetical protein HDU92_007891, partial [Lobulomyces angularis]